MDVLIAGGGTGGHLFPGIAVAQEVRRRDPSARILFVGTPRGIEAHAVPKAGFELALLNITGLRSMGVWRALLGLARLPWALVRALALVARFRPQVAVSVGGYAAGPAVLASRALGVPCVVMEQNAVPGLTNRLLGRLARRVIANLPTRGFAAGKVAVLGNPVRADLLPVRERPYDVHTPRRVLVLGGSQGARALNDVWVALAPRLGELGFSLQVMHQTGSRDFERVRAAYAATGVANVLPCAFIDDMAQAYAEADLVICRAGATTLAELTVCGRPAVLVPFPFAVDDHQTANARALESVGAALCVPQAELDAERMLDVLRGLCGDAEQLRRMAEAARAAGKPEAAAAIVDALAEEVRRV